MKDTTTNEVPQCCAVSRESLFRAAAEPGEDAQAVAGTTP